MDARLWLHVKVGILPLPMRSLKCRTENTFMAFSQSDEDCLEQISGPKMRCSSG